MLICSHDLLGITQTETVFLWRIYYKQYTTFANSYPVNKMYSNSFYFLEGRNCSVNSRENIKFTA